MDPSCLVSGFMSGLEQYLLIGDNFNFPTGSQGIFKDGLGELQNVEVIYIDSDAQPRFHDARQVPFAIKPRMSVC